MRAAPLPGAQAAGFWFLLAYWRGPGAAARDLRFVTMLLYLPFRNCPRFQELEKETLKSKEFQKRLHPYKGVHNFTLPSWVIGDTMAKLRELSELSLLSLYGIHKQKEKSRLQGGVLVGEVLNHMRSAAQPASRCRLIMYSAHDTTVSGLQMVLYVYNGILPPYASCHLMELYLEKGEYFIEMYYRNETQCEPHALTLPVKPVLRTKGMYNAFIL
ncbi:prostatic acid phosphatase-like isoform X3 [Manis javanica]|uniref:prostatic acid phosphatase-like isoform X3 n=1 Tax=Manis javanica TaxID=9974 RepID=UPI003C6D0658